MLGTGGMSVVVKATHLGLGDARAVKILRPGLWNCRASVERFHQEGRTAARLGGDHVVRMYDSGELDGGAPYLVMEYLSGVDLRALLQLSGQLSIDEALLYVAQACDGLESAHAQGIVHCDLKPSNLFLTRGHDGAPCVKVIDFGIAETRREARDVETRQVCGTLAYMAPEQAGLLDTPRPTTDVWALGIVLYELVTAQLPFYGATTRELLTDVVAASPVPPRDLRDDVPRGVEAVILRCLEKRPACRYADAGALKDALVTLLRGPSSLRCSTRSPSGARSRRGSLRVGRPVRRSDRTTEVSPVS